MKDPYLLVLFYSASGNVRGLAHAIANGAEYEGLPTKLRTVNRISREGDEIGEEIICTKEELVNCSGLACLLYTSPSPRDSTLSRMPSSA